MSFRDTFRPGEPLDYIAVHKATVLFTLFFFLSRAFARVYSNTGEWFPRDDPEKDIDMGRGPGFTFCDLP